MRIRLSILDRYLFKQFAGPFLLAVGGFALIGIVDILMVLVEMAISRGIPALVTFRLLLYKLPAIMVLFFPMASLFAVMLLLVRMAKDNELTVLRSSGVRTSRILFPIFFMLILSSSISFFINEKVVPWANTVSDELIRREVTRKPPIEILENVVFKVPGGRYFYIKKIDEEKSLMENVLIFEQTRRFPRVTTAKTARWNDTTWRLYDGAIYDIGSHGDLTFYDQFKELNIHVDRSVRSFYRNHKTAKEMDSKELKEKIVSLTKGGISTRSLQVEYYMKQSIPVAVFIFGVVGIAFCLSFVRSGKDWWGVIVAICAAVLMVGFYFFMIAVFRALGKDGAIAPFLAAWTPNIIYGTIGLGIISYQSVTK